VARKSNPQGRDDEFEREGYSTRIFFSFIAAAFCLRHRFSPCSKIFSAKFSGGRRPHGNERRPFVKSFLPALFANRKRFALFSDGAAKLACVQKYLYFYGKSAESRAGRMGRAVTARHSQRSLPIESSMRNCVV
jgi:hypothetical protein